MGWAGFLRTGMATILYFLSALASTIQRKMTSPAFQNHYHMGLDY